MRFFLNILKFALSKKEYKILFLIILAFILLISSNYLAVIIEQFAHINSKELIKWIAPIIAIIALYVKVKTDWENTLPKRLTVVCIFGGKEIVKCKNAFLSDEGDIRTLGQQIGSQMFEARFLNFAMYQIKKESLGIFLNENNEIYKGYKVAFKLYSMPSNEMFRNRELNKGLESHLEKMQTHTLIWEITHNEKKVYWKERV